jgi:hypothetical protein
VDEIGPALTGTGFVLIRPCRNPAADNLARDVPAHAGVRQGVHHFRDAGGKLPQSIGEFLRRHAGILYMTNDQFSMTDFQSFQ